MCNKEWKDITNYEGIYQVSNYGDIRRWRKKYKKYDILKLNLDSKGYYKIMLSKNSIVKKFWIHSIVAKEFLNHIPNKMNLTIDHIDNNKLNNYVGNLQIISNRDNIIKGKCKEDKVTGIREHILVNGNLTYHAEISIQGYIIRFKRTKNINEAKLHYLEAYNNINNFINIKQFKNLIYGKTLSLAQ